MIREIVSQVRKQVGGDSTQDGEMVSEIGEIVNRVGESQLMEIVRQVCKIGN